jgi:hypothetical protein
VSGTTARSSGSFDWPGAGLVLLVMCVVAFVYFNIQWDRACYDWATAQGGEGFRTRELGCVAKMPSGALVARGDR